MAEVVNGDVQNLSLADEGLRRIEWAYQEMPVLRKIEKEFKADRPLEGVRVSACLHVTTETANLMRVLVAGGAEVALCASNPLSTQDDVAAALVVHLCVPTFAVSGASNDIYYKHINEALRHGPQITMDDGADLIAELHRARRELLSGVLGGTEETTTGVIRLRAMAAAGALSFPVVAVNDAMTKHLFDNRYGTGQSVLDSLMRASNVLIAGKTFTVAGYGWCGRGVARRADGMGANVLVTEVDPLRALEAHMDGFRVMPMAEAASISDFIVTATGDKHVVDAHHFSVMKDGCMIANAGHFNVEINIPVLEAMAVGKHKPRPFIEEFELTDGRRVRLLAEGRLVNLVVAEGHPAAVMDMSFANQSLSLRHIVEHAAELKPDVYPVPEEIDREVAQIKLQGMEIAIDSLTPEQVGYLSSWEEGT
jgi:adenosylhomocysteinase